MTDSDFQSLKPVESLHNIQGLTPARPREDRKRRQNASGERSQPSRKEEGKDKPATGSDAEPHAIDYCA